MNLWALISSIVISLGISNSSIYDLPIISVFSDNSQASIESVALEDKGLLIPHKTNNLSLGVKISAQAAAVIDKDSDTILWQKNAREERSIASISKLMTALVFLDHNPGWEQEITMQASDEINGGTNHLLRDEVVKVKDVFYTALIASDNSATRALVRSTGLSEEDFVREMNAKAKSLGLLDTSFVEATGLNANNKSTAFDVLHLAKVAFAKKDIRDSTAKNTYDFQAVSGKNHHIVSTNKLLNSYLDINAGKTGFINASGYCLVSEFVGDNGQEIIGVVLGSDTHDGRFQELKILSSWILENFSWS